MPTLMAPGAALTSGSVTAWAARWISDVSRQGRTRTVEIDRGLEHSLGVLLDPRRVLAPLHLQRARRELRGSGSGSGGGGG
jgi:hypothetical protein